jgi:CRP/FNR family cyclic AMP-dependent transcriptional regulator
MNEAELLQGHPFARGLSEAQVGELAACARSSSFPAGSVMFREGGEANALYLILSGRIVLEQHVPGRGDVQLESLTGGDILGLSWLFPGGRWVLDARTVESTEVLVLDARCVHARMDADASLGLVIAKHVIEQLYQRLERVRLQRLDVYRGEP